MTPLCPKDRTPMAVAKVSILFDGKELSSPLSGYLCAKCRTIWSETHIDEGIDLRKVL